MRDVGGREGEGVESGEVQNSGVGVGLNDWSVSGGVVGIGAK